MIQSEAIEKIRLEGVKHGDLADWYRCHQVTKSEECHRFCQRICFDFIDIIEESKDNALVIVKKEMYGLYNEAKYLKDEGFKRLAEYMMIRYRVYAKLEMYLQ